MLSLDYSPAVEVLKQPQSRRMLFLLCTPLSLNFNLQQRRTFSLRSPILSGDHNRGASQDVRYSLHIQPSSSQPFNLQQRRTFSLPSPILSGDHNQGTSQDVRYSLHIQRSSSQPFNLQQRRTFSLPSPILSGDHNRISSNRSQYIRHPLHVRPTSCLNFFTAKVDLLTHPQRHMQSRMPRMYLPTVGRSAF